MLELNLELKLDKLRLLHRMIIRSQKEVYDQLAWWMVARGSWLVFSLLKHCLSLLLLQCLLCSYVHLVKTFLTCAPVPGFSITDITTTTKY